MPHVCCASTAACSIRNHFGWSTRPGTRHRKEVPDEVKSSMSNYGWDYGKGRQETQRVEENLGVSLTKLHSTCSWKFFVENENLLDDKNYFQPNNFLTFLFSKKTWIFISTERQQMIYFVLAKWKIVYLLLLWWNDLIFEWLKWSLWVSTGNHKYYRAFVWMYQYSWDVLIENSWSDSFIVFLPQWQIIWGMLEALYSVILIIYM